MLPRATLLFTTFRQAMRRTDASDAPAPLVPADTTAGRALVIVIAIMTFLAALTAGAVVLLSDASAEWRGEAATEAAIQLRAVAGRDIEADLKTAAAIAARAAGVRETHIYTKAESEALLAPWLGTGLDLSDLPIPRMIVLKLDPKAHPDLDRLRIALYGSIPGASLDDHHVFIGRLGEMAETVVLFAIMVLALVLAAMGVVVASATRAAVATNREIVEVLHIVGAADDFIADQFRHRFLALGLRGAAIGGGAALIFFPIARLLAGRWRTTAGGSQLEAMFGAFDPGVAGYAGIIALIAGVALMTGYLSRAIVLRHLRMLD
jgi:cell division transport system permease protein